MLVLYATTQFKKDLKKATRRGLPINELDSVIKLLPQEEILPE